jgi:flavin reductase (DIM6/NTAB) family NADH-FMN oxidoreductase RutF
MIDHQQFRDLMAGVCAPVTVVTTMADGAPHGATVSSFASLSLDPPLVSVAFDRGSTLLGQVRTTGRFGVNVLGVHQDELAMVFARRGLDRFAGVDWHVDAGLPRLTDALSWLDCDLHQTVEAGDHLMLFGLVRSAGRRHGTPPLVYADRTFGTHSRFAERPRRAVEDLITACTS